MNQGETTAEYQTPTEKLQVKARPPYKLSAAAVKPAAQAKGTDQHIRVEECSVGDELTDLIDKRDSCSHGQDK